MVFFSPFHFPFTEHYLCRNIILLRHKHFRYTCYRKRKFIYTSINSLGVYTKIKHHNSQQRVIIRPIYKDLNSYFLLYLYQHFRLYCNCYLLKYLLKTIKEKEFKGLCRLKCIKISKGNRSTRVALRLPVFK